MFRDGSNNNTRFQNELNRYEYLRSKAKHHNNNSSNKQKMSNILPSSNEIHNICPIDHVEVPTISYPLNK